MSVFKLSFDTDDHNFKKLDQSELPIQIRMLFNKMLFINLSINRFF